MVSTDSGSAVEPGGTLERPLKVESNGIDRIPESEQTATLGHFVMIVVGSSFNPGVMLFGWLAMTLGLGFWSAMSSIAAGTVVGLVVLTPLILIGSRTATNNATASGAHFGVRGRQVGALIGLAMSLLYTALAIWTSGDAIVSSLHRLVGTPQSDLLFGLGYAVAITGVLLVALYGFALMVRVEVWVMVFSAALIAVLVVAMAGDIDLGRSGGEYVLGSFWTTWALSAVAVGISGPLAFITLVGDWTRYISPTRYPARRLLPAAWLAIGAGTLGPAVLGAVLATAFDDPYADFVPGIAAAAPTWAVPALLLLGPLGAVGLGSTTLYSAGLNINSIVHKLSRVPATALAGLASLLLVYVGALVLDAQESITATATVLVAVSVPWAVVVGIGLIACRGRYLVNDLQVFSRGEHTGAYWFWRGWNPRAVVAWLAGAVFGVLAVSTPLYKGPLADMAGGIDISFPGASLISGVLYLVLRAAFPERHAARKQTTPVGDWP